MLSEIFNGKAIGLNKIEDEETMANKQPQVEKLFKGNQHKDILKTFNNDSNQVKQFFGFSQFENKAFKRINQQKGLSLWGDYDKDKVANILDCNPLNPMEQGTLTRLKNWTKGKGWKEDSEVDSAKLQAQGYNVKGVTKMPVETVNPQQSKMEVYGQNDNFYNLKEGAKTVGTGIVSGLKTAGTGFVSGAKTVGQNLKTGFGNLYEASGIPDSLERKETERLQREGIEKAAMLQAQKDPNFLSKVAERKYFGEQQNKSNMLQSAKRGIEQFDIQNMKARRGIRQFEGEASKAASPFTGITSNENKINNLLGLQSSGSGLGMMAGLGGGMTGRGMFEMIPRSQTRGFNSVVDELILGKKPEQQPQGYSPQPSRTTMPQQFQQPQQPQSYQPQQSRSPEQAQTGEIIVVEGVQYKRNPPGSAKAFTNLKTGAQVGYPRGRYDSHSQNRLQYPQPPMPQQQY